MTDLEITRRCAERMGYVYKIDADGVYIRHPKSHDEDYDPLNEDAQAMALVKKFTPALSYLKDTWIVLPQGGGCTYGTDLNRAICEYVAQLPTAPAPTPEPR